MASADDVIAALEQAKRKLLDGKTVAYRAASLLGKTTRAVGHTLGRTGVGSPLLSSLDAQEKALVKEIAQTDTVIKSIDEAIAQVRHATGKGGAAGISAGGTAAGAA
jgi:hypothetical protein